MTDPAVLLARFRPVLQLDSQESFFADSAAILADRAGNLLRRAGGQTIAGPGTLSIAVLGRTRYSTGAPVQPGDYLDATGRDYVAQARAMHRAPYANRVHGHAVRDAAGALWLQYWLFHYYNDKAFLGFGLHEGDWEMIQLRLGADEQPQAATYAQHSGGQRSSWAELEHAQTPDGPVPLVYSARGSHASYFAAGTYPRAPFVPDRCDGKGWRGRPELIPIGDTAPAWSPWPGRWGSTRARVPGESDSPTSPRAHRQWADPAGFHAAAEPRAAAVAAAPPAPPAPEIRARRDGDHAVVEYRARPGAAQLVLSVDGVGDDLPPATETHALDRPSGEVAHATRLEPGRAYRVRASVASEDGVPSQTAEVDVRQGAA